MSAYQLPIIALHCANSSNVSAFASALLNAFLLPTSLAGETGTVASALNDWGNVVAAGGDGQSNAAPHVSVNIVVFDKNFNFLDAAYEQIDAGAEQVGVLPVVDHDYLTKEYTVKEEGYVFMYIANENETQVDAYFDDVSMTHTPTNVVQYNEYYPFGLQASTSWTRENNTNNFLYNEGSELNADAGWYETMFRGYDASLGRFMQVDPLAHLTHNMSPYQYANNSPALRNDPSGLKSPAPPGVSQMGWERMQKIVDRENNNYSLDDWSSDAYGDASKVSSGQMGLDEYIAKYSKGNYWLVYNESQLSDGSLEKQWSLYNDRSYWNDVGANFSNIGEALAFAVYKTGYGSEYWGAGDFWDTSFGKATFAFMKGFYDGPKSTLLLLCHCKYGVMSYLQKVDNFAECS